MRVTLLLGVLLALVGVLFGSAASTASHSKKHRCAPSHARIEARGPLGVAYKKARSDGLYGCLYSSGRSSLVEEDSWYPRPAVDINGRLIGSAAEVSEAAENSYTTIAVQELRPRGSPEVRLALMLPGVQITSLRVKSAHAVAWIECTGDTGGPDDPRPDCVAPGRSVDNSVVKRDSATDTSTDRNGMDLVADGRDIDPLSLELHGSRLSWIQGGARHFAALR
jgi:hypothetical protein